MVIYVLLTKKAGITSGFFILSVFNIIDYYHLLFMLRYLLIFLGTLFLALGIVGIFLPVLPTTPFVLLTAACWANASPRFHHWLINHPYFGSVVQNWQQSRAVPLKAKILSTVMMSASCALLFYRLATSMYWLAVACSLMCLAVAFWLWRLPNAVFEK